MAVIRLCRREMLRREDVRTARAEGAVLNQRDDSLGEKAYLGFREMLVGGHSHQDGVRLNPGLVRW